MELYYLNALRILPRQTAFTTLTPGNYLMILVGCVFLCILAIKKEYEPLLLVPIAFGMLLVNIYPDIMANPEDTCQWRWWIITLFLHSG